jgi:hypothetical protein
MGVKIDITLKEEYRLMMFGNRALKILGTKRVEIKGGWRKVHNEELHNLYSSQHIVCHQIKGNGMGEANRTHGRDYKVIKNLCQKT